MFRLPHPKFNLNEKEALHGCVLPGTECCPCSRFSFPLSSWELVTFLQPRCCSLKPYPLLCHPEASACTSVSRTRVYSAKRRTPRIFPLPCRIREFSPCIFAETP